MLSPGGGGVHLHPLATFMRAAAYDCDMKIFILAFYSNAVPLFNLLLSNSSSNVQLN
jgi:hypothetical protein